MSSNNNSKQQANCEMPTTHTSGGDGPQTPPLPAQEPRQAQQAQQPQQAQQAQQAQQTPSPSPPQNDRKFFVSPRGINMTTYTTYETMLKIHPDHAGFVIGTKGATIRSIGIKHRVDAKLRKDNKSDSYSWPYIQIRGMMANVEAAHVEFIHVANIANEKIPRIQTNWYTGRLSL
jgi:hypothetical protein